ncbi:MAG: M20/M25/M40 family metallo-hydrolase [Myxococcales bacterium]|nr:M20/M25/M40 family metallo-hydrolase [Myxococcales bacterium]
MAGSLRWAAHRCGHDGHMAIVSGLAPLLYQQPPERGRVVLLYQPAEETGEGARRVLDDPRFAEIRPDFGVGLHNLPGHVEDTIVVRAGTFSCASVGMIIELIGSAAHAAEPEQARSPASALAALLAELPQLSGGEGADFRLCTITHAHLGERSFGATPERAVLGATLRAHTDETLEALRTRAQIMAARYAKRDGLEVEVNFIEAFPATRNDPLLVDLLRASARGAGCEVLDADNPFRWSEDFGHFARAFPCVYFGLGIGVDAPRLHQPDYSFRDETILPGVRVLHRLVHTIAREGERAQQLAASAG